MLLKQRVNEIESERQSFFSTIKRQSHISTLVALVILSHSTIRRLVFYGSHSLFNRIARISVRSNNILLLTKYGDFKVKYITPAGSYISEARSRNVTSE